MSLSSPVAYPFAELPQSLVLDMLSQCNGLSSDLTNSFNKIITDKEIYRKKLLDLKLLKTDSDLFTDPVYPTTCGIDGSYVIENLLSIDVLAIAGVAVEGLSPPTEERHWERPRHLSKIYSVAHSDSSRQLASALMMCMELELAVKAPHNIVFFDGSLSTPLVHFRKALNVIDKAPEILADEFSKKFDEITRNYNKFLKSTANRIKVGVPKYTTQQEVCNLFNLQNYEDRGFLSFILEEGEYILPQKAMVPYDPIDISSLEGYLPLDQFDRILQDSHVIYYRPSRFFPVIRLEVLGDVAFCEKRLRGLFETLKLQCEAPGMFEPFPLYLADRMVKHLRVALPALRKAATQTIARTWEGNISNIYLALHGYRSRWG